jgi:hypothetical protein
MTSAASGSAPASFNTQGASGPKGEAPHGEALLACIGNTPLLPLDAFTAGLPHVKLLGKAEW